MRRAGLATMAFAALLAASAWGLALEVREPATVRALPGAYATLAFGLTGDGTFDYVVTAPAPWQPLSTAGSVRVGGNGFVSVTLRVPRSAPAGAIVQVDVAFTARDAADGAGPTARAVGRVEVLPLGSIELIAPEALEGHVDEALRFAVIVRNAGNRPDRVALSATQPMWTSRLEPSELELGAGEEREVVVVLEPVGEVSSGYRMGVRLQVMSLVDPDVRVRRVTVVTLLRAGAPASVKGADAPPALTLRVRAGLAARLTIDESIAAGSVGYDLRPRLEGDLSDYVSMSAGVGRFAGEFDDPFRELPSRLDLALQGETWSGAGSFAADRYALAGSGVAGDWRIGGATSLVVLDDALGYGVGAFAGSLRPDLDLQLNARVVGQRADRTDILSARYRRPLGQDLDLSVGADLVGSVVPDGYRVQPVLSEGLTWRAGAFDLAQSYSGLPLAGLHTVGLSGGTRAAGIGVRASASAQFAGDDPRWSAALALTGNVAAGLGAAVDGSLTATGAAASWTVRPAATYRVGGEGWSATLGAGYAYTGLLRGVGPTGSVVRGSASVRVADLRVTAAAAFDLRAEAGLPQRSVLADGSVGYRIAQAATLDLAVRLRVDLDGESGPASDWRIAAGWQQRWASTVESRLTYEQHVRSDPGLVVRDEQLAFALSARDVGLPGVGVAAGYAVSSATGLFTGLEPLRHDLSLRVGYTLVLPFETPEGIVATFGGRRGGSVEGTAFLDRNLDGVRDPDEPGLAGVAVRVGDVQVVTDDDGGYRLRVPAGTQPVGYGAGVPSSVVARGPDALTVEDDGDVRLDLPFAPSATLRVTLFDDLDGDGVRSDGEPGIAYGGVLLEGPLRLEARMDGRGSADVTGLVPGRYTVRPDPDRLPARYRTTTETVALVVREGDRPAPVQVGAGAPPPTTVTTFAGAQLAVLARAEPSRLAPGADTVVVALVNGAPERVLVVTPDGNETELVPDGTRWTATIRLPRDAPTGPTTLVVRAEAPGQRVEGHVALTLVDRPLAEASRIVATVGEPMEVRITTAFAATSVTLDVAGRSLPLHSADGYVWTGSFMADEVLLDHAMPTDEPGRFHTDGCVRVDGHALATAVLQIRVRDE